MTGGLATRGFSVAARYIDAATSEERRELQNLHVFGNKDQLFEELWTVWQECRVANWDGYQALPVCLETYRNAYLFLESLPLGYPLPSIGAEPDGALTIEWHQSARRTLSVSVNSNDELDFAGLFGPGCRVCGTESFFGEVPATILALIQRVYAS